MSDDRPPRYLETLPCGSELVVYRASGLGGCERSIVATARGIPRRPHPDWFQAVLDEGTAAEPMIRARWRTHQNEHPDDPDGAWRDQATIELPVGRINGRQVIVRGHADDLYCEPVDGSFLLREYKKFRDSTWPEFQRRGVEVQPYYPWQVSAMMWGLIATGAPMVVCEFVGGHWDGDGIIDVEAVTLVDPPLPRVALLKRIARLERLIEEGWDPSEVECSARFPCGHWFLHDDIDDTPVELDGPIGEAAARWMAADQSVRQLKAAQEAAQKKKDTATTEMRALWPAGESKAEITLPDGETVRLTRVQRDVETKTIERKGYTSDYFQKGRT